MPRGGWAGLAAMGLLLWSAPGRALTTTVELAPSTTSIGLTVWGMGVFPLRGRFGRFAGVLSVDPAVPGACRVQIDVAAASLRMDDGRLTPAALGPRLLDAGRYPALRYGGKCDATAASGALTLHGVTHPVTLRLQRNGAVITAGGTLLRGMFGVDGYPGLVGRHVEMRIRVTLPSPL